MWKIPVVFFRPPTVHALMYLFLFYFPLKCPVSLSVVPLPTLFWAWLSWCPILLSGCSTYASSTWEAMQLFRMKTLCTGEIIKAVWRLHFTLRPISFFLDSVFLLLQLPTCFKFLRKKKSQQLHFKCDSETNGKAEGLLPRGIFHRHLWLRYQPLGRAQPRRESHSFPRNARFTTKLRVEFLKSGDRFTVSIEN